MLNLLLRETKGASYTAVVRDVEAQTGHAERPGFPKAKSFIFEIKTSTEDDFEMMVFTRFSF